MQRLGALCVAVLALVSVLAVPPPRARAAEEMDIDKMIESAKTPADHEAIAAYYDHEAAAARAKAEEHRKMGEDYKKAGGALTHKTHFDEHCQSLVRIYEGAAKENAALAAAHRQMAKQAK